MYENNQSPMAYLAAFALSFAAGALAVICTKAYVSRQQRQTNPMVDQD